MVHFSTNLPDLTPLELESELESQREPLASGSDCLRVGPSGLGRPDRPSPGWTRSGANAAKTVFPTLLCQLLWMHLY
jgi:hypothetical protein